MYTKETSFSRRMKQAEQHAASLLQQILILPAPTLSVRTGQHDPAHQAFFVLFVQLSHTGQLDESAAGQVRQDGAAFYVLQNRFDDGMSIRYTGPLP